MLCIARAYRGQPLERTVIESSRNRVYLVKPSTDFSDDYQASGGVGFPLEDVFAHDAELLDKLTEASESGDEQALKALWAEAQPLAV